jgi:WXG100 family type VII secretion target
VLEQSKQVEKVNPAAIQKAADQFHEAATNAGDHGASLKQSTDALQGGVWSGPAADAFFGYVKQITDAGDKVQKHLQDVSTDLGVLQGQLADIKGKIQTAVSAAEKTITDNNTKATSAADNADAQAAQAAKDDKPAPSPSSAEIISAAKAADEKVASQARTDIDNLLKQADDLIKKSQELMKTQVEGGYSTVPLPGKDGTLPQRTGGVHSNGGMSSGGGGGGGGGGGLGPSGGPPSTTPPGNVQQWIQEAIKILQAAGVPVTDADISKIWTIIEKESGGNPNAINNWDCVPIDTTILTRRGWLKHDEVRVGDETIGYNQADGSSAWTRISRVVHHEDAPLVRLGNSRWHATTTPNHRWLTLPRVSLRRTDLPATCPECAWEPRAASEPENGVAVHRRKMHGVVPPKQQHVHSTQPAFVTTEDVRSRDRLMLAAPAKTKPGIDITVREAAILGWIAGDGHVESRRHRPTVSIAQSKSPMVEKIRELLDGVPHADYVDDRGGCGPRHQFRLDHDYAQDLLARAGHPKSAAVTQVLAMSTEQRAAWLEAITDAEGTRSMRPGYTKPQVIIYQAPGTVLGAIALAVYLAGSRPRVLNIERSAQRDAWSPEMAVRSNTPVVTGAFLTKEDAGRADVWCVTTELGTWTAREDDHIFLTGNSNAAAGHPSKGLMQCIDSTFNAHKLPGHDNIYDPVDSIIAGVRYTFDRYGGFAGHPGLKAMAGGGGYQGY